MGHTGSMVEPQLVDFGLETELSNKSENVGAKEGSKSNSEEAEHAEIE